MKTAELNDILLYNNQLCKVTGIADGKIIIMTPIRNDKCKSCGASTIYVMESSPNFQNEAYPVKTIKE